MKISLLILSWWCFSCLDIQRIGTQYIGQLFWKNNTLEKADIIFINKLQFLIFFHFSDLWNLVQCMDSMVSCYSLLNMKVIWFYLVSAPPPSTMGGGGGWGGGVGRWLNMKIYQYFVVTNFFLTFMEG